jgi:hypothetical protein
MAVPPAGPACTDVAVGEATADTVVTDAARVTGVELLAGPLLFAAAEEARGLPTGPEAGGSRVHMAVQRLGTTRK